ncbi:MAG: SPOR domain-containing protein [Thermodesulfobacteriota bacterium]
MKKFAVILAGLVLLAILVLVLLFFSRPAPAIPGASNASSGNATASNATASNATAPPTGNATAVGAASNATNGSAASNATAGNATASGPPPAPHDLVAGAYLSPGVANATARDLRERGLAPAVYRRPDDAGAVWWEVHLGRFPDAAAARAEADRLGAEQGVWARPRPVDPQAKPVAAVRGPATVYLVSAGQYLTRHAAEERGRELAGLGFEPCVFRTPGEGDLVWYAVVVGQAKSGEEAEALSAGLAAKTGLPSRVSAEDAASLAGRRLCE